MNIYGFIIVLVLIFIEIYELVIDKLNYDYIEKSCKNPPGKALTIYTKDELKKSAAYIRDGIRVAFFESILINLFFFTFLIAGCFQWFASLIIDAYSNLYLRAIIFFTFYQLFFGFITLPFDAYKTFKIEKNYGFNRTKVFLYIKDIIVKCLISFVILSIILIVIILVIRACGDYWYIYGATAIFLFYLSMIYLYPTVIAPLFNKFEPLKDKELEKKIFSLAEKAKFPVKNIFQIDASKRTTHSNAYFTGFGKNKRIVLFDTLLKNHTTDEILSILAHEIGHYKKKHLQKMLFILFIIIFISFFVANFLINSTFLYKAFGFEKDLFTGLFIISILLSPCVKVLKPLFLSISRKHEYEADNFAMSLIEDKKVFIDTLIKLHKDNLSYPIPHPLYVKVNYSHPPLLERIANL